MTATNAIKPPSAEEFRAEVIDTIATHGRDIGRVSSRLNALVSQTLQLHGKRACVTLDEQAIDDMCKLGYGVGMEIILTAKKWYR